MRGRDKGTVAFFLSPELGEHHPDTAVSKPSGLPQPSSLGKGQSGFHSNKTSNPLGKHGVSDTLTRRTIIREPCH